MNGPPDPAPPSPPLQFGLSSLLLAMVCVAVLFGTLRWLGVSTTASAVILAILVAGGLAAVGLLAAIARAGDEEERR